MSAADALPLLGTWRLLRADPGLDFVPGMRMEFLEHGRLRYSFDVGEHREMIAMHYVVDGSTLRTEVPGTTHAVAAGFEFGPGNVLVFHFGDAKAWLLRELESAPPGGRG